MHTPPRITLPEMIVLQSLTRKNRKHYGMKLIRDTGIKSGTMFVILRRFEERGYVVSEREDSKIAAGRPCRKYLTITYAGRQRLQEALNSLERLGALGSFEPEPKICQKCFSPEVDTVGYGDSEGDYLYSEVVCRKCGHIEKMETENE